MGPKFCPLKSRASFRLNLRAYYSISQYIDYLASLKPPSRPASDDLQLNKMFGQFFSQFSEKQKNTNESGDSLSANVRDSQQPRPQADRVNDFFSSLNQTQQTASQASISADLDPFAYLISPEKSTVKPHVSKQKPALLPTEADLTLETMPNVPLFSEQRDVSKQTIQGAWEEIDSEISDPLSPAEPSDIPSISDDKKMVAAPAPSLVQSKAVSREDTDSVPQSGSKRAYLSNLMSSAGNLIKQGTQRVTQVSAISGVASVAGLNAEDREKVIQVLAQENQQLREVLGSQQQRVEDLQDEIEVHKSLEEEAHEQNEELLFKVKYLEQLAIEKGNDLSALRRIEELGREKRGLTNQVDALTRQIRLLEKLNFSGAEAEGNSPSEAEEEADRDMFENPKRALHDLKSLFEQNKIQFSRSDEARVLTAIYTQDKPVIRLYRELLFRRIAQKAIQSAESLFKQSASSDRNGEEMCKLMIQNKRLMAQNGFLKSQLAESQEQIRQVQASHQESKVKHMHKLGKVQGRAETLESQVQEMQASLGKLRAQAQAAQDSAHDEDLKEMNIQKFSSYLTYFLEEQRLKVTGLEQKLASQEKASSSERSQLLAQIKQLEANERSTKHESKKTCIELQAKVDEANMHYKELQNQLSQVQSEKATQQDELGEANQMLTHLTANHDRQYLEIQTMQETITEQSASIEAREQEISRKTLEIERKHSELAEAKAYSESLQEQIQSLQALPQASPVSGEMPAEVAAQQNQDAAEAAQQVSELEKMLEEREEEIIELMAEVNKLQESKSQSPEVVTTLQILKSKLSSSQQRFQEQQPRAASSSGLSVARQQSSEQKTTLARPAPSILIEDQTPADYEKSSQGSHPPAASRSPDTQQSAAAQGRGKSLTGDSFNTHIRAKLEDLQQQRREEVESPPISGKGEIVKNGGRDSNFFNQLIGNSDKKNPLDLLFSQAPNNEAKPDPTQGKKGDMGDLFGFLAEPAAKPESLPIGRAAGGGPGNNVWSEAFALQPLSTVSSINKLTLAENAQINTPGLLSACNSAQVLINETKPAPAQLIQKLNEQPGPKWGSEDSDISLDEQKSQPSVDNSKKAVPTVIVDLNSSGPQTGEIQKQPKQSQRETQENVPSLIFSNLRPTQNSGHSRSSSIDQENAFESPEVRKNNVWASENSASGTPVTPQEASMTEAQQQNSHHKRTQRLEARGTLLSDQLETRGDKDECLSDDEVGKIEVQGEGGQAHDGQESSYIAAIESLAAGDESASAGLENSQDPQILLTGTNETGNGTQDLDSDVYERLMTGEQDDSQRSGSDSMLHNSPFNNSFTRQETDMVVNTIRKCSLNSVECSTSPLLPSEEKKVNVSTMSDLVPEEPLPHGTEYELYEDDPQFTGVNRLLFLRHSSLNEVEEVDEDVSDDLTAHSASHLRAQIECSPDRLPTQIHERADSATVLDVQSSSATRKASAEYQEIFVTQGKEGGKREHKHTPSLMEEAQFEQNQSQEKSLDEPDQDFKSEQSPSKLSQEVSAFETNETPRQASDAKASKLKLLIPEANGSPEKRAPSTARSEHRLGEVMTQEENPFAPKMGVLTARAESESEDVLSSKKAYESLAEFTRENIIKYQADGKTESAVEEVEAHKLANMTADFNQSKGALEDGVGNEGESEQSVAKEEDELKPQEVTNINGSGFFSRDWRVLKNATYGNPDQSDMILKQLHEEHGQIEDFKERDRLAQEHEQNIQSFAEEPTPTEEPSIDQYSVDQDLLLLKNEGTMHMLQNSLQNTSLRSITIEDANMLALMNNSRESFENLRGSFDRGSLVEDPRIQSLLGSMVQQQDGGGGLSDSMTDGFMQQQNSIEEEGERDQFFQDREAGEDDGIPHVENYQQSPEVVRSDRETESPARSGTEDGQPDLQQDLQSDLQTDSQTDLRTDLRTDLQANQVDNQAENQAHSRDSGDESLETVEVAKSTDISPVKPQAPPKQVTSSDTFDYLQKGGEVQSNQQDCGDANDGQIGQAEGGGTGWEDDTSLEEVDDLDDGLDQVETEGRQQQVSANEQVSDATDAPVQGSITMGQGLQADIGSLAKPQSPQLREEPAGTGWDDASPDLSIDDNDVLGQQQSSPQAQNEATNQSIVDLSETQRAEIGTSDKFACPNGHPMMVISGKKYPLASQECSAYCGMANQSNDKDWLCCRDCFYKVCNECFHCPSQEHELAIVNAANLASGQDQCASCGEQVSGSVWACSSFNQGATAPCLQSIICLDCLNSRTTVDTPCEVTGDQSNHQEPEPLSEDDEIIQTTAQNEQQSTTSVAVNFDDLFGPKTGKKPASGNQQTIAQAQQRPVRQQEEESKEPERIVSASVGESGQGGGWGDDDDDLSIE